MRWPWLPYSLRRNRILRTSEDQARRIVDNRRGQNQYDIFGPPAHVKVVTSNDER
ncbi:hypothetical protein CA13_26040 [Planctomycetes bacterium CA13]|uniref:Uncharacterized protein n=1 Tax=Novipirellula herctigrandis TaxID=2527986 RepID=A0A5C5Z2A8_9BACT|nr:hypothetical protein CA13_26040 [Planctomycetes bacterium CA13]